MSPPIAVNQPFAAGDPPRPSVTLAWAQSLDGSLAAARGAPTRLSGPAARVMTHSARARHDAILVGIGTVLADDPRLTVRLAPGVSPQPVVLDSRLRIPSGARVVSRGAWLATTPAASAESAKRLTGAGATVLPCAAGDDDRVDLADLLRRLARRGIRTLMVEGGGAVLAAFLAAGLADRVSITVAPVWLNGYRPLLPLPPLRRLTTRRLDGDLLLEAML